MPYVQDRDTYRLYTYPRRYTILRRVRVRRRGKVMCYWRAATRHWRGA